MNQTPSPPGDTRITPSAPSPERRSQIARTNSGVTSRVPAASGSSTKSFSVPCPFTKAMPSATMSRLRRGDQPVHCGDQVGLGGVEPLDPSIAPEPGSLPANEPPGRADGCHDGLRDGDPAVYHLDELGVAQ